ncbi:hypothetical protein [Dubosiella newyorkensis]|uniref:hypothetical protein n=1 Tax=Dubosiella newyorkensis TaxID=1862672 RepID=UPI003F678B12
MNLILKETATNLFRCVECLRRLLEKDFGACSARLAYRLCETARSSPTDFETKLYNDRKRKRKPVIPSPQPIKEMKKTIGNGLSTEEGGGYSDQKRSYDLDQLGKQ